MGFFHSITHAVSHTITAPVRTVTRPIAHIVHHVTEPITRAPAQIYKPVASVAEHVVPYVEKGIHTAEGVASTVYNDGKSFVNNNSPGHFFDRGAQSVDQLGQTIFNNPMTYVALVAGLYFMSRR